MTLAFLALLGAPYIYDISSLRVKEISGDHCGDDKILFLLGCVVV